MSSGGYGQKAGRNREQTKAKLYKNTMVNYDANLQIDPSVKNQYEQSKKRSK